MKYVILPATVPLGRSLRCPAVPQARVTSWSTYFDSLLRAGWRRHLAINLALLDLAKVDIKLIPIDIHRTPIGVE